MYIVGVDIAKRSHEAVIIDTNGNIVRKAFNFKNDSQGFKEFVNELNAISSDRKDFVIGMESTSHYWLTIYSNLRKLGYKVEVFNPIQSNALRGMYIRQVKNDEKDSFVIAEVIRFGRYTKGGMPPSDLFELRELCRARSFIVDMTADLKKKVISLLDQVFPEYETLFTNIFGVTSTELLITCSTPEEILSIDTRKLTKLIEETSNNRFGKDKAKQIKDIAKNSFGIVMEYGTTSLLIKQYMEHIRYTESQISEIESKIFELYSKFDSYLTTIPGIGPVLAATILSEVGDISRFSSPAKLAAFAGIDPSVNSSGEFVSVHNHMSKRGSPYLRRALWQASVCATNASPEMKEFLQKKRAEGKPYMNAIGHVTRKMTNIIFAVMRDQKPYYSRKDI